MDVITLILLIVGAVAPLVVAAGIVFFGTRGAQGNPAIAIATLKGIVIGAASGLIVCGIVIGLVLGLRAVLQPG